MPNGTSESLKRNIQRILAEWEAQAYKNILSSVGITSLVLKNALQSFLEHVADALSTTIERTDDRAAQDKLNIVNFAKIHGGSRAIEPLHYTLAEVILEFQILQRVIFEVLEEKAPIPMGDRDIIIKTINQALSAAASQFAEIQRQTQEQFALTLVHDLRNPINTVKMSAHIIKQDATASAQSQLVAGKIDKNMDRLEAMLKELLDVSRIRAGMGLAFEFEEVGLDVLTKEVIQEMKELHGERFELHADEPTTGTWNRAGLRRVLENLVVNALKYGSQNTPIRIIITQTATHAVLTIHNEGNPIPVEEQPTLFEKFLRASTATSKTGWGLGLALVSGMVKAHHGTVRVESSQAKGTDFIVELPKKP